MRARIALVASVLSTFAAMFALADPPRRSIDASRALDAGAPAASSAFSFEVTRTPPDPPPLTEAAQWVFDLRWDRGEVWLLAVHRVDLPAARATPRVMGRFAIELFEGPTLIERARFDFPLLGASDAVDAGFGAPPSLATKLRTRIGVMFPATKRGTRLDLVDRASGRRWTLPWPPRESTWPPAEDAGVLPRSIDAGKPR